MPKDHTEDKVTQEIYQRVSGHGGRDVDKANDGEYYCPEPRRHHVLFSLPHTTFELEKDDPNKSFVMQQTKNTVGNRGPTQVERLNHAALQV